MDTLGAIQHFGVLGILSAADQVTATLQLAERQGQALNAVRELHYTTASGPHEPYCHECLYEAPCPTIRAIDEAGA
ncbi:hypothetical protein H7J71_25090 [Mycolicibacterium peregrinum]|nr:hypothetical protein [Mycolicibacterium peregrinum]